MQGGGFLSTPGEVRSEEVEERAEVCSIGQPPRRELISGGVGRRPNAVPCLERPDPPQEQVVIGVKHTRKRTVEVAARGEEEVSRHLRRAEAREEEARVVG